nr:hypothetical protein BVRB_9g211790 [Ipomoea batatas]
MTNNQEITLNTLEEKAFKDLFHDYSQGKLHVTNRDYWSTSLWQELSHEYNNRAKRDGLMQRSWEDMIRGGKILNSRFCMQKPSKSEDRILKKIFEPCDSCQWRIPVFEVPLLNKAEFSLLNKAGSGSQIEDSSCGAGGEQSQELRLVNLFHKMKENRQVTLNQLLNLLLRVKNWINHCGLVVYLLESNASLQEKVDIVKIALDGNI